MRKQYILLIAITFLLNVKAWAQYEEYSGKMHVTPLSLKQVGDSVYIRLSFDISGVNVDSHKSISLITALVTRKQRLYLPEVMVKGRENFNVHRREMFVPEEINYVTNTSPKKSLMDLVGGVPYRYMLREFFPSLRKAVCRIDFEVKSFDVNQAKEVMKTRPQNLSLNEIFLVANSYKKGSQEFIDLFETAVKLFPNNTIANLNAATAALERKDLMSAEKYLTKIDGEIEAPEYYNIMGVLLMLKGKLKGAEDYFHEAARKGLDEANRNLKEIAKKRESNSKMEV